MLETGVTNRVDSVVTERDTAIAMRSGELPVFATPALAALMEQCAAESVSSRLEEGQTTVGSHLELSHTRPTPVGMKVYAQSRLTGVEGRRLTFEITACDERGEIGCAKHARVIVDAQRFMNKCR